MNKEKIETTQRTLGKAEKLLSLKEREKKEENFITFFISSFIFHHFFLSEHERKEKFYEIIPPT